MSPATVPPKTAGLISMRDSLTGWQCREVIAYLAGHSDPVVRDALAAGIAGALVAGEPLSGAPDHAIWRRKPGKPWEVHGRGLYATLSLHARRERNAAAMEGSGTEYQVLPLGEEPGQAVAG